MQRHHHESGIATAAQNRPSPPSSTSAVVSVFRSSFEFAAFMELGKEARNRHADTEVEHAHIGA